MFGWNDLTPEFVIEKSGEVPFFHGDLGSVPSKNGQKPRDLDLLMKEYPGSGGLKPWLVNTLKQVCQGAKGVKLDPDQSYAMTFG